ncbi:hypothetical protein DS893_14530 [Vibrionales bacterium C3R12]|nr:hypothetical protein DS893_14530 [Vibrionales bacterium C3R12]
MTKSEKFIFWAFIPLLSAAIPVLFGWQVLAELNGWIPRGECPTIPLKVSISSPGNGVKVPYLNYGDSFALNTTTMVIEASRGIPKDYDIALLTKNSDDTQFHLKELSYSERVSPTLIRKYGFSVPIGNAASKSAEVRAVIVTSMKGFGQYYSSLDQIATNKSVVSISEPISIKYRD